jgi:5-carboxymethyl-2-hydroxymuconate isomerase
MPHCIFEYSANIADEPDWLQLVKQIHEKLVSTGLFVAEDIKSRIRKQEHFVIGRGEPNQSFVTLNLQILEGRSDEIKRQLTQMALDVLAPAFPKSVAQQKFSITVQVTDIHRASYKRQVNY